MAVRLGTTHAETAYTRLRRAGAALHNDEIVLIEGSPLMFFFADPDGNGLVYLEADWSSQVSDEDRLPAGLTIVAGRPEQQCDPDCRACPVDGDAETVSAIEWWHA